MNIYTLSNKMTGEVHSVLNGKMFYIKKNKPNKNAFIVDIETNKILVTTTDVEGVYYSENGLIIKTASGTMYGLINVNSLLPTYDK